jgi:uroporphyrinogen decarboxylase
MIQGISKNENFNNVAIFLYKYKKEIKKIIQAVTEASKEYVNNQIQHGIDAFQLFDTHAGIIPNDLYYELFIPSIKEISNTVRSKNIPFIYFPKGLGLGIKNINFDICDYLSIDWQIPIPIARQIVDKHVGLQGNLDPRVLLTNKDTISIELEKFLDFGRKNQNWIFNLGHGVLPETPFENAKFVVDWIKSTNWNR